MYVAESGFHTKELLQNEQHKVAPFIMKPASLISTDVQMCHFLLSDSHSDDFDPASTKSKYDSMDFDSLLREAQYSLRR